jgi:hypothetical protein
MVVARTFKYSWALHEQEKLTMAFELVDTRVSSFKLSLVPTTFRLLQQTVSDIRIVLLPHSGIATYSSHECTPDAHRGTALELMGHKKHCVQLAAHDNQGFSIQGRQHEFNTAIWWH